MSAEEDARLERTGATSSAASAWRLRRPAISYGWWVVLAGTALSTLVGVFSYYGMGIFFNAIRDDLGWSAAALGVALALARIQGGVLAPIVGLAIDRYGSRRLILLGVLMTGSGFVLLGQTTSIVYFYVVFIVLVQGGISAGMGNAPSAAVVHWFTARRATALGVLNLGISLGGILAKPLAEVVVAFGWRTAFVLAGVIVWVVGLPLAFVIRRPGDSGGTARAARATRSDTALEYSPMEALRTLAFWSIAWMFAARHFVTGSVALFLVPLLQERGMSLTDAATVLSLMAFIGMPGRVGFAWLGDRMDKRAVIALCLVFQSAGLILFTALGGTIGIVCFLVLYSPTYSGVLPLIPAIQADYFGAKWFATIAGMMAPITTISVVSGPLFVTAIRDLRGSFEPAFVALAMVNVLALVFVALVRVPRGAAFARA
ncbi:MAG: MFS transporter [Chloroflexi bacterium]|nr:MFS transporter [Chloroflexota bacterium]